MTDINDDDGADRYINLPEHLEREVLKACLSSHFETSRNGNTAKEPRFYKQFTDWKRKSTDPSAKSIYNIIRKITPIIKRDKNIIFTITKGYGVFYRIRETYLIGLCETIFKDNTDIKELIKAQQATEDSKSEIPDTVLNTEAKDSAEDKEGLLDIDTASLEEVVEDLNKRMDKETAFLQTEMETSFTTQLPVENIDITAMINKAIATEIPKLMVSIRKEMDESYKHSMKSLEERMIKMEEKVKEHHKQMEISLEKSRKMCDTFRHRSHFCTEKLKEVEKSVEEATLDITENLEDLVELKSEDILDNLNDVMESAERDIAATMITFHNTVKAQSGTLPIGKEQDGHEEYHSKLEALHGYYTAKLDSMERRIDHDTKYMITQMDETLCKKLVEIEAKADISMEKINNKIDTASSHTTSMPPVSPMKHEGWNDRQSTNDTPTYHDRNKHRSGNI